MGQPGGALLSDTERPVLEGRPAAAGAYQDALDYLFARTTGKWKFGLERVEALLDLLGRPHDRLRCLHVGGTNGKGSVCATLEAVLRARGLRVAKYTSPHLVDFRERFLVDGTPRRRRRWWSSSSAGPPTSSGWGSPSSRRRR
jgi:folylpolyglutamate synthase/dihydropteroate synthase